MHHAAVDDAEGQPHQHGHYVLGESISEAVFRHCHNATSQYRAAITRQQVQRAGGGGVEQQHLLLNLEGARTQNLMFYSLYCFRDVLNT